MKRLTPLALVLLFGCGCGCGKSDAQKILGEWVVVDYQSPAGEDRGQRMKKVVINEGNWAQQFTGDQFEDFEYTLNPKAVPKEIDLTDTAPDGTRRTVRCIYELEGDRMRVCLGTPPVVLKDGNMEYVESRRPTAFDAKHGAIYIYRRAVD